MRSTQLLALATVLALLCAALPGQLSPSESSDAWVLREVNGNKEVYNITFESGGGTDDSAQLLIPDKALIYSARIGVKGMEGPEGKNPSSIWMDVGKDGDIDWMFWGVGYGSLGLQNKFPDNRTMVRAPFRGDGVNDTFSVYLPKGAHVTEATMDVTGVSGLNDGMMIKVDSGNPSAWVYSSRYSTMYRPSLTITYTDTSNTVLSPEEYTGGKDAKVAANAPDTNYGDDTQLITRAASQCQAYLEFDLTTLEDKSIADATLKVRSYHYAIPVEDYGVHEVLDGWDEHTITWNNKPSFDPTPVDTFTTRNQQGSEYFLFNVTSMIQLWLADSFPNNVTVDFGADLDPEYEMSGELNTTASVPDFSAGLNSYLLTAQTAFTDKYGNSFVEVPIRTTSNTSGIVEMSDLNIEYDWTATVFENPHNNNLTVELRELMKDGTPIQEVMPIDLLIHTETSGKLQLRDINITYNDAPRMHMDIPSNLSLDEDTAAPHLVDLTEYFYDDYMEPEELDYTIKSSSGQGKFIVDIVDGHFVKVDASTDTSRDLNGQFHIIVSAADEQGFTTESNTFMVTVNPVNDEPVRGEERIPDRSLAEGGASLALDLDEWDYFRDVEDDELFFTAVVDPVSLYEGENITVEIDNMTKDMVVRAHGDFAGEGIPVRIYCDDNIGEPAGVYWDLEVDVVNVNDDPPVWSPIPDVHVEEDGRVDDALHLEEYVTDVDNPVSGLRYTVISTGNGSVLSVKIDDQNYVDIRATADNWTGATTVWVRATDDGENAADTSFEVIVDPADDDPLAVLKSPDKGEIITARTVSLEWEGFDAETPAANLTYNIYMGEGSAGTLLAEGVSGNRYEASVEDGRTYRWTVAAGDGDGYGPKAKERVFSVDLTAGPRVSLESPQQGAFVTEGTAILSWTLQERPSGTGGAATFDIYLGKSEASPALVKEGVSELAWEASGLENGMTYYWNVVPRDSLGTGTCLSGTWSFDVDFSFAGYGVGLTVDPVAVTMRPGSTGAMTVTITNTGAADDNYKLGGSMADVPGAQILIDSDDPGNMPISLGGSKQVTVSVMIPGSTAPGTYVIILEAKSLKGGMEQTTDVTFTISETAPPTTQQPIQEDDTDEKEGLFGGESGMLALVFLIIVIVLMLLIALMFAMFRKKSRRVDELEGRRRLEPAAMVDAELAFSPDGAAGEGLGGAAGAVPASQQLRAGGEAGVAGAAAPEPLALPKVATGGETPEYDAVPAPAQGTPAPTPVPTPAPTIDAEFAGTGDEAMEPLTPPPPAPAQKPRPRPKPKARPRPKPKTGPRSRPEARKPAPEPADAEGDGAVDKGGADPLGTLPGED